jgi:hypothetical protein
MIFEHGVVFDEKWMWWDGSKILLLFDDVVEEIGSNDFLFVDNFNCIFF